MMYSSQLVFTFARALNNLGLDCGSQTDSEEMLLHVYVLPGYTSKTFFTGFSSFLARALLRL